MIPFLLQPLFIFLLAIFQASFLEFFSVGPISIEITFAFVIYAGLRFGVLHGAALSFLLGVFIDCIAGPIWGLNMFLYVLFFYMALLAGAKIDSENRLPVSLLTGICFLLQGALRVFFYWFMLDINILYAIPKIFLPEAVILGILTPPLYAVFNRFEALSNAEVRQPDRQL